MMRAAAGVVQSARGFSNCGRDRKTPNRPLQVRTIRGCLDETDWHGTFPHTARLLRHNYSGSWIENKLSGFRAAAEIEHVVQRAGNCIGRAVSDPPEIPIVFG